MENIYLKGTKGETPSTKAVAGEDVRMNMDFSSDRQLAPTLVTDAIITEQLQDPDPDGKDFGRKTKARTQLAADLLG
jgi:hypothetical protein